MLDVLKRWYQTRFSDPDAVALFLLLVFCFAVLLALYTWNPARRPAL